MTTSDAEMAVDQQPSQPPPATADETDDAVRRVGDQFLASLNHDIRTPLSGIMGMTDLLLETELSSEQQEYVQTTRLCADQLLEMLNAALEYAALSSETLNLEPAELHLPEAIRTIVNEYRPKAEAKGLTLSCQLDPGVPAYAISDEVRFRQVLWPLLNNAVKFTAQGGVQVQARVAGQAGGEFTLSISVIDTGIGIASDRLQEIFESFRQLESGLSRSYPGLGLGLAVSRKLATLMGGDIQVESEPAAGSTFVVRLPMQLPEDKHDSASGQDTGEQPETQHRVLLVEDNAVARQVVSHILRHGNYTVDAAEGGRQGIEAAARYPYRLILMDLQMPDVNGLDAAAEIRKLEPHKDTPIVALTANYSEEMRNLCREAGFQDFLPKPVQRDDLIRAVARYVG